MVLMENLGGKEIRDLKDKRDKKGRGGLESVTCAGAGQAVKEMLRLCIRVSRS